MSLPDKLPGLIRRDIAGLAEVRRLCLTLMLVTAFGLSLFVAGGHDGQRVLQIGFLLIVCALMLAGPFRIDYLADLSGTGWGRLLSLFFALGTLSAATASSPRHAFYELASLLLLLLLSVAVAREIARDSARYLSHVLKLLGFFCLLYSARILATTLFALLAGVQPDVGDFAPGFSNYRLFNHAQTVALPLLALLFHLDKPGARTRPLWFLLAAFWWAVLIVTAGRGTFIGLMFGCAVAGYLRRGHARAFCRAMLLTGLSGVAIYAILFFALPLASGLQPFGVFTELAQRSAANPTSSRTQLWWFAIELIRAHPFLGVGPLHYAHETSGIQCCAHPHDWLLQIGAEWGLPALLCLCGAIGLAMRRLLRTGALISDARQQAMLTAWLLTGVAILVDGLVSGVIVMPASQLIISLYLGCAGGWVLACRPPRALAAPSGWRRLLAVAIVLASAVALSRGVWPEIGRVLSGERVRPEAPPRPTDYPRLWRDGFF